MAKILPIKNHPTYYIHSDGYVFREVNNKKVPVDSREGNREGNVFLLIDKKKYNLLFLMIECFGLKYNADDRLTYKFKDGKIPLDTIVITPFTTKTILNKQEELLIHKYKCDSKAAGANSRSSHDYVSPYQLLMSLRLANFQCTYCAIALNPNKWEVDHYKPFSKGGRNTFENIVPCCNVCNKMKGTLLPEEFIKICGKIFNKNKVEEYVKSRVKTSNYNRKKPNKKSLNELIPISLDNIPEEGIEFTLTS